MSAVRCYGAKPISAEVRSTEHVSMIEHGAYAMGLEHSPNGSCVRPVRVQLRIQAAGKTVAALRATQSGSAQ
jgi:hypothetical protein